MDRPSVRQVALLGALMTPVLMGVTPIFGKLAIRAGVDPFTLSALRTCMAALLLWGVFLTFFRHYIYIFPAGLLGTLVVGSVNGLGSLLYYNGLLVLDNASLAQLLNMTYVVFAMLFSRFYGNRISWLSGLRALLAMVAVYLLTSGSSDAGALHWEGVVLMLGSACLYALHIVLSQRVMFEMPAPTMALYALSFMSLTVLAARLVVGGVAAQAGAPLIWGPAETGGWVFILALTGVTALSRVTLFVGVRGLGGLQAILLNVAEIGVTLLAGFLWLGERMTAVQWVGALVLLVSVLLSHWEPGQGLGEPTERPDIPSPLDTLRSFHIRLMARPQPGYAPGGD